MSGKAFWNGNNISCRYIHNHTGGYPIYRYFAIRSHDFLNKQEAFGPYRDRTGPDGHSLPKKTLLTVIDVDIHDDGTQAVFACFLQ